MWGSNRCYLLFDKINWRPNFYVATDNIVVPDNHDEINRLISELQDCTFFFQIYFCLNLIVKSKTNTYWYEEFPQNKSLLPGGFFSHNAGNYVRAANTVTIAALQLAVYLGFNPIYLIGCDTDYTIPSSIQIDEFDEDIFTSEANDDPNHFSSEYFGTGKKYSRPSPDRMIFAYKQAQRVCNEIGIDVFNATIGGKLEEFPRVSYDSLFVKNDE